MDLHSIIIRIHLFVLRLYFRKLHYVEIEIHYFQYIEYFTIQAGSDTLYFDVNFNTTEGVSSKYTLVEVQKKI